MNKQWKMVLGIGMAVGLLTGCGGQSGRTRGAELLTPGTEVSQSEAVASGEEVEQADGFLSEEAAEPLVISAQQNLPKDDISGMQWEAGMMDESVRKFSYRLMAEGLTHLEQENPVLSPISAYMALSMAATGAQGETKEELESLLGAEHRHLSERCMAILQSRAAVELELANSAWLDQRLQAKEEWLAGI